MIIWVGIMFLVLINLHNFWIKVERKLAPQYFRNVLSAPKQNGICSNRRYTITTASMVGVTNTYCRAVR